MAPFLFPRLPGIADKLSYPDLYCGVPLWENESQANQTRVASVTMRTVRVPGEFQAKDLGMEEDLSFFFKLLRCIALSLMFLFSFLLML